MYLNETISRSSFWPMRWMWSVGRLFRSLPKNMPIKTSNASQATPLFLKGGSDACLLIHGFSGSTYEMRELGEFLHRNGYTVSVISLAGHGTVPSDLAGVRAEDWIEQISEEWQRLSGIYNKVYPIGLSMGALLVVTLALIKRNIPAAVLLAPALVLKGIGRRFIPFFYLLPVKNLYYEKKNGSDIIDQEAKKKHLAYNRVPLRSIFEFYRVQRIARSVLPLIDFPVQVIYSERDNTVSEKSISLISAGIKSGVVKVKVDNSGHVLTVDRERNFIYERILEFLKKN